MNSLRLPFLLLMPLLTANAVRADSVIVFNEVSYHPPAASEAAEVAAEWVELVNQMAVDVDMSGWSLGGGVSYVFPAGTVLTAGSYLVVAATPANFAGALGPWSGKLDNGGENLELRNNNGRVMDALSYGTDGDWPAAPDGGGASLARAALNTASAEAASWRASRQTAGTPGTENFGAFLPPVTTVAVAMDASWKYLATGADPGSTWKDEAFVDTAWSTGGAGFQLGTATLPSSVTVATALPAGPVTYYFRRAFSWSGAPTNTTLTLQLCVDDGAAAWLNGTELVRTNLPATALTAATTALSAKRSAPVLQEFTVPSFALHNGTNVLAVEVHQAAGLTQGAAMLFYTPAASPADARLDGPYTIGSRIRVGATAQQLTHLGVQDADAAVDANDPDGADGLTGYADDDGFLNGAAGVAVGIWNTAGTLLASASVVSTDPHFAGWRYKPVAPITLAANTDYFIGARVGVNVEWFLDSANGTPPFAAEPEFSLTLNTFASGAALARPANDGTLTLGRWGAANALLGAPSVFTVGADTTDAVFAAKLTAQESAPVPIGPPLVLNEISLTGVEIMNTGSSAVNLSGAVLREVTATGTVVHSLPAQSLAGGGWLSLPLSLTDGARLVLVAADGVTVLDSAVVKLNPRARFPDGTGAWLRPSAASFGAANVFALHSEIVINEIMFAPPSPPLSVAAVGSQWIELHNKSAAEVDLSGWRLDGTVDFTFPANTLLPAGGYLVIAENPATLPGVGALGPWSGSLSRDHDRIVLKDTAGNPADEAAYYSGGHWPEYSDGGGSSLELRDPDADRTYPQSWAASDETGEAGWQTFTWRGPANLGIAGEPAQWREIDLCLLDGPGEVLIDDVRVTDLTLNTDLIQNGNFNAGLTKWRATGTHRLTSVISDAGNNVLRVVATGPGEYQGNQVESTFFNNTALVPGREYEISLRARWLAGGGRLNARLYFNRIARTHDLAVSSHGGTPGQVNSRAVANLGPSVRAMAHSPAVPAAAQAFTVSAEAADPDGMGAVSLKYSVNAGAWQTLAMTASGPRYSATIPGQAAAALVQFYIEATDGSGAVSQFPPGGTASRAMCAVQDGAAAAGPAHKFRLVMPAADATAMHANVNCLGNAYVRATIIADERDIYYDAGVRLKGSYVGRNVPRVGFTVRFQPEKPFRGIHDRIAVDRSQHAAIAQGEIIAKHIATKAGGIPGMYDDLARFVHVTSSYNSSCQLRLTGFEDEYLDSSFPRGGDGQMYEYEVLRWTTATSDGTVDGTKLPGSGYSNPDLQNQGNGEEAYRWNWLGTNHRAADDFTSAIAVGKLFSLTGTAFDAESKLRLDVDQFLRTLALQTLVGPNDVIYTGSNIHNIRFCSRAHDGKMMYLPWDWDSCWSRATNATLNGGGNVAKLVTVNAHNQRQYLCHVFDLVNTTYNTAYMTRWTQHYGAVAGESYTGILNYIGTRAAFALTQLPTTTAWSSVAGTPNANGAVTITGTANIRVAFIEVNGIAYAPVWSSNTAWSIVVPLAQGGNTLAIRGLDKNGLPVAGATSTLNVTNPNAPGWPGVKINEWLAENDGSLLDPADGDSDDWLELFNPTASPVDLSNWSLSDVPAQPRLSVIPAGTVIPAGGFLLVWADNEPAQNTPGVPHVAFRLSNAGETLGLYAPDSRLMDSVTFAAQTADDTEGRYADGSADLFTLTQPTPGAANVLLVLTNVQTTAAGLEISFATTPGRRYRVEFSTDLVAWSPLTADTTATGSTMTVTDPAAIPRRYYRAQLLP